MTESAKWVVIQDCDSDNEVHVIPDQDLIFHTSQDCACGPLVEPVGREDGSMGWLINHHSLDGRELSEGK